MGTIDWTVAEFFAGIGLMGQGLELDGWRVTFSHDIDPRKMRMYAGQYDADHYVLGDIHELDAAAVPTVTLATASFPCTDVSIAGKRAGLEGAQSSALWGFVRVIDEMGERRPPLILIENVPGLLSSRGGQDLEAALAALNHLGYGADMFVVNASHFLPQNRERLFIVGLGGELKQAGVGPVTHPTITPARPRTVTEFIVAHPGLIWRLRDLPPFPERSLSLANIVEHLPDDDHRWWSEEKVRDVLDRIRERYLPLITELMAGEEWSWLSGFWRGHDGRSCCDPRMDGIAGCLRAGGGFTRQLLLQLGHGRLMARWMTPTEAARLMGAGDFRITVSVNQALTGFGDAVCVPVVQWIAAKYLRPLLRTELELNGVAEPAPFESPCHT
ncbi:MAG: DNA (cytosine-5-)-methyltransferase [Armatimonadia bacterium]